MSDCSVISDNGEHTRTKLDVCEELWNLGQQFLQRGYNPTFVAKTASRTVPRKKVPGSRYSKDLKLCEEIISEGHKLMDAGYNPKITCEFKPIQEYVESTGMTPDKRAYMNMRSKYGW